MQKVLIIGSGGSGKTTLGRRIAELTGLPLVHLDALFWREGWVPTPDGEWDRVVAELINGDAWILDGNYGRVLRVRLAACDTVIFLDLPPWLCLWRILKRRFRYKGRRRPDLPEGCPERLNWEFARWVLGYRRNQRPGVLERLSDFGDKRVVILRSQSSIERFVASVEASA